MAMRKSWLTAASVLAAAAVEGQPAHATFILDTSCGQSNCSAGDMLNLNMAMNTTTGSGVVDGTTVNFTTAPSKVDVADGFADISPTMGASPYPSITFTPTSNTLFGDFSFRGTIATAGTVDVTWTASDGATGTVPFTEPANSDFGRAGIVSNDAETLASVTLSSSGFKDVRQIEFSLAAAPPPVPEPATLTLLGTGLFGFGLARRLRRKT